ncbi:hypothetical protein BGZ47_005432 [Haplosporangium gracile]|nr:hypothetical protein BGZ47_005432 [Haplosporangium gracile]
MVWRHVRSLFWCNNYGLHLSQLNISRAGLVPEPVERVTLVEILPAFNELTKLHLLGDWKAALEGVETEDQLQLRMTSLSVEINNISLTRSCPGLVHLAIGTNDGNPDAQGTRIPIRHFEDMEYLATVETVYQSVGDGIASVDTPVLPGLEELTITCVIVPNVEVKLLPLLISHFDPRQGASKSSSPEGICYDARTVQCVREVSLQDISLGDIALGDIDVQGSVEGWRKASSLAEAIPHALITPVQRIFAIA